jgi:hypothetical protein
MQGVDEAVGAYNDPDATPAHTTAATRTNEPVAPRPSEPNEASGPHSNLDTAPDDSSW